MDLTPRRVTSAADMRAVAHPLRLRLLELLASEGPFTASEAARRLGDTPANVSWHLRLLARHGFVRQRQGPGRTRPWKLVALGMSFGDDAEDQTLATALGDLVYQREFDVLRTAMRALPAQDPAWREAATVTEQRAWLTAEETAQLGRALAAAVHGLDVLERNQDPSLRPPGARQVDIMAWAVPVSATDVPATTAANADESHVSGYNETGEPA